MRKNNNDNKDGDNKKKNNKIKYLFYEVENCKPMEKNLFLNLYFKSRYPDWQGIKKP